MALQLLGTMVSMVAIRLRMWPIDDQLKHLSFSTSAIVYTRFFGLGESSRTILLQDVIVSNLCVLLITTSFTSHLIRSWYGFNPGSALLLTTPNTGSVAALAASNTSLAAAAGAISGLFVNLFLHERRTGEYKFDLVCSMNGALSGLIAITAGCATVEYYASVLIGLVGGAVYVGSSKLLIYLRLDDAVDGRCIDNVQCLKMSFSSYFSTHPFFLTPITAIPVHMFSGAWGLIATGLFTSPARLQAAYGFDQHVGLFYEFRSGSFDAILLLNQVLALLFIFLWCVVTMGPFFVFLNYMGW